MLCPILTSAASAPGAETTNPAAAISASPTAVTAFLPCMLPLLAMSKCDAFAFGAQEIGSCQVRLASASAPRALLDACDGDGCVSRRRKWYMLPISRKRKRQIGAEAAVDRPVGFSRAGMGG